MNKTFVQILAGGIGSRMNSEIPKQFLDVDGVPIIVDAIRNFEKNSLINGILVICVKEWISYMKSLVGKYGLSKIIDVIPGGDTGHDSSRLGVLYLQKIASDNDFLIIHDAARPIITQEIINDMLNTAYKYGNACSSIPCYDTVILTSDQKSGNEQIERSMLKRVQTPQCYQFGLISSLYKKADNDNIHNFVYANTMAIYYGTRIYFSLGSANNVKITTPEDIIFYKALKYLDKER